MHKYFNPIADLVISTGAPTNEANVEIETHPLRLYSKYVVRDRFLFDFA